MPINLNAENTFKNRSENCFFRQRFAYDFQWEFPSIPTEDPTFGPLMTNEETRPVGT